ALARPAAGRSPRLPRHPDPGAAAGRRRPRPPRLKDGRVRPPGTPRATIGGTPSAPPASVAGRPRMRRLTFPTAALAPGARLAIATTARADKPVERFTAFAVDMSAQARPGARTGTVDITINRWSTPEERRRLADALRENGPDGLLKEPVRLTEVREVK